MKTKVKIDVMIDPIPAVRVLEIKMLLYTLHLSRRF